MITSNDKLAGRLKPGVSNHSRGPRTDRRTGKRADSNSRSKQLHRHRARQKQLARRRARRILQAELKNKRAGRSIFPRRLDIEKPTSIVVSRSQPPRR
jgi:hypothetical protein